MKNIAHIMNKPVRRFRAANDVSWPLPDQMIGIELEAERKGDAILPGQRQLALWTCKEDHSLLNGVEFVFNAPLKGEELSAAIEEMFEKPTHIERYMTGSTHIHLDMTEEGTTHETVKSLVFIMFCLESVFFEITDPSREYCGYTNKLVSAPEALLGSVMSSNEEDGYNYLVEMCADHLQIGRYYGLNLLALDKFGSVEFRYFPTAVSAAELVDWVKLVMHVKKAALKYNVSQLMKIFNSAPVYERWIAEVFAPWADQFLRFMPFHKVADYANKAIAAAASCTEGELKEFKPEAITTNPALSKYVKAPAPEEPVEPYPYVLLGEGDDLPRATDNTTVALWCGNGHRVSLGNGLWENVIALAAIEGNSPRTRNILATFKQFIKLMADKKKTNLLTRTEELNLRRTVAEDAHLQQVVDRNGPRKKNRPVYVPNGFIVKPAKDRVKKSAKKPTLDMNAIMEQMEAPRIRVTEWAMPEHMVNMAGPPRRTPQVQRGNIPRARTIPNPPPADDEGEF